MDTDDALVGSMNSCGHISWRRVKTAGEQIIWACEVCGETQKTADPMLVPGGYARGAGRVVTVVGEDGPEVVTSLDH